MKAKKLCFGLILFLALGLFLPLAGEADPQDKWTYSEGQVWVEDPLPHLETFEISFATTPAVGVDGTIYAGDRSGHFFALNPDGIQKWAKKTGAAYDHSPAIGDNGTVYAHNFYVLYAFNPADGEVLAAYHADCTFVGDPAIAKDGTVYIGAPNKLYAFYPNLELKWEFNQPAGGEGFFASPVIDKSGTIYCMYGLYGTSVTHIFAVNPNGTLKAISADLGINPHKFPPAIGPDGTIYVAADCWLYALRPSDLNHKWMSDMATYSPPSGSPVMGIDGIIYVPFYTQLRGYNANGGGDVGSVEIEDNASCTAAVGKDWTVYFGSWHSADYNFWGHVNWTDMGLNNVGSIWIPHNVITSPAIVGSGNEGVLIFGLQDSVRAWTVSSSGLAFTSWPCHRGNLKRNGRVREFISAYYGLSQMMDNLIDYPFPKGITSSLTSKLESARQSLEKEDIKPALNKINAFINEVTALTGKKIPAREAGVLIAEARGIVSLLR